MLVGLLSVAAPRADAHEIGTSHVVITLTGDGAYVVDVATDAAALLARLETSSGQVRSGSVARDDYRSRIAALAPAFLAHVSLRFDGSLAGPTFDTVRSEADADPESALRPPTVVVRLRGQVPAGAQNISWSYDLTSASYAVTFKPAGGAAERVEWLEGGQAAQPFPLLDHRAAPTRTAVALTYVRLGFTHILPKGLDHILFVLGIFLFGRGLRPMLWQVSAFTVAHSITLGLALYGVVSLPASIVEPLIAVSIVYVAVENLVASELQPWRVALVFGFGLLHGLGFAGVLRELALPRSEFLTGLIAFNVGVEAGQLTVIAGASLLVAHWATRQDRYRRYVVQPASCAIALVGAYWTVTRIFVP